MMEPLGLNVFFIAPVPVVVSGNHRVFQNSSAGSVFDAMERSGESNESIGTYTAEADGRDPVRFIRDSNSADYPARLAGYLRGPEELDPRIAELARQITAAANSNYARAPAIETYLKSNFGYTLELPAHRADPLCNFLFVRKKRHCEVYSSAIARMLRTLAIPTRAVSASPRLHLTAHPP